MDVDGSSRQEGQTDVSEKPMTRARVEPDGSVVEIKTDGSTRKLHDATDDDRLRNTTDEEINVQIAEDPDVAPILDEAFWENARLVIPDVIDRYKKRYGKNYQMRMFEILKEHIEGRSTQ